MSRSANALAGQPVDGRPGPGPRNRRALARDGRPPRLSGRDVEVISMPPHSGWKESDPLPSTSAVFPLTQADGVYDTWFTGPGDPTAPAPPGRRAVGPPMDWECCSIRCRRPGVVDGSPVAGRNHGAPSAAEVHGATHDRPLSRASPSRFLAAEFPRNAIRSGPSRSALGLIVGSFLNVVIHRMPLGERRFASVPLPGNAAPGFPFASTFR